MVWTLWGAKETAYKVLYKKNGTALPGPLHYEITIDSASAGDSPFNSEKPGDTGRSSFSGIVEAQGERVFFRTESGPRFVHCIGADQPSCVDSILSGIEQLESESAADESPLARRAAARHIAACMKTEPEKIEILSNAKNSGPPRVYLQGDRLPVDLSLSHDFPYIAYAFIPEAGPHRPGEPCYHPRCSEPRQSQHRIC